MYLDTDLAHFRLCAVVEAAVVEDEFHVLHELLDALILLLLQLTLYSREVHRVLHYSQIVDDAKGDIIDRIGKDICLLIALQGGEHPRRGLLPLVEDWSALRNLGHREVPQSLHILALI